VAIADWSKMPWGAVTAGGSGRRERESRQRRAGASGGGQKRRRTGDGAANLFSDKIR